MKKREPLFAVSTDTFFFDLWRIEFEANDDDEFIFHHYSNISPQIV